MSTIQYISADLLQPGDNTRKTFNAETLTRLKGSIRTYGVRRNLEVKAIEGGRYEIVTGERRWRATMELLAEMEGDLKHDRSMLPCLVLDDRDISHAPVLNIIENLLRDDVPPGEEAEGYYQLTLSDNPDTGKPWTVAEIAEAVNQQPSYIRRRMQLRRAPAMLLDAVNAKKIPVTVAELVGRIPSRAQRDVAAKLVLWPGNQEVPMDFEQAKKAINDRFYKSLNKPGFSIEDETLVPVMCDELTGERLYGGDCESCPHRSGRALEKEELAGGNEDGGIVQDDGTIYWPLSMPQLSGSGTGLGSKVQGKDKNPMFGNASYVELQAVFRITEVLRNFPNHYVHEIGKIVTSLPGGYPTPNGRNWITMPIRATQRGNCHQITRELLLGPHGGWPKDIYDLIT